MVKFAELSITNLHIIVNEIDAVFDVHGIDANSKDGFWECVEMRSIYLKE